MFPFRHFVIPTSLLIAALLAAMLLPSSAAAGGWRVDADASRLSFVSVKNGKVGETHAFTRLGGQVDEAGHATLTVDLDSVDTGVEIRDQRMRDMLFETSRFPAATITATLDDTALAALAPGEHREVAVTLSLDLHGKTAELPAILTATGLADGRVLVATRKPVIVGAASFDLGAGIEALRSVVSLESIVAAVPVTAELVLAPTGN